jgi:hypothetical protein
VGTTEVNNKREERKVVVPTALAGGEGFDRVLMREAVVPLTYIIPAAVQSCHWEG